MRPGGEREIAGWRLSALTTQALVLERRANAASAPTSSKRATSMEPSISAERIVIPIRMQSLTSTAAAAPSPSPMSGNQPYAPTALPSTVMPILAPRPEATR